MTPDQFDAYSAGFFDGEGSIDIRYCKTNGGKYERFYLRCAITQKRGEVLELLRAAYGGSVTHRTDGTDVWVSTTANAGKFLQRVLPYLVVKKDEAEIALEFQATFGRRVIEKGVHRVQFLPVAVRDERYRLMMKLRDYRTERGLFARDRASVPTERGVQAVPRAA